MAVPGASGRMLPLPRGRLSVGLTLLLLQLLFAELPCPAGASQYSKWELPLPMVSSQGSPPRHAVLLNGQGEEQGRWFGSEGAGRPCSGQGCREGRGWWGRLEALEPPGAFPSFLSSWKAAFWDEAVWAACGLFWCPV